MNVISKTLNYMKMITISIPFQSGKLKNKCFHRLGIITCLSVFTLLCAEFSQAQQVWKRNYHMPNARIMGFDAFESYDYGYMIVSTLENLQTDQTYGWIIKTDINGNKLWHLCIGQDGGSDLDCMIKTNDGGEIVGGRYVGYNWNGDAYIMKLNACAESEWCVILPDNENNYVGSIIRVGIVQLPDGGYICERYRSSTDRYSRLSLIKLSSEGEVEWINYYDTNHDFIDQFDNDLILTSDNCVMVAGTVYDTIYPGYPYVSQFPHFYKVDLDGNLLWERKWHIDPFQVYGEPLHAAEGISGNYYCGGAKLTYLHPYVYKLSTTGDTLESYPIIDDSLAVGGIVSSVLPIDDTTLLVNTACWRDLDSDWRWSLNFDDTLCCMRSGICEAEVIWNMQTFLTHDNKIVMKSNAYDGYPTYPYNVLLYKFNFNLEYDSIYTLPYTYDSLCPHPIVSDTILLPTACRLYTSLPDLQPNSNSLRLRLYPNPASQFLTVEIPEYTVSSKKLGTIEQIHYETLSGQLELSLIDLSGHVYCERSFNAMERNQVINVEAFPNSIYMIIVSQDANKIASGKCVVSH
jgi:hypothetical protein